MDAKAPTFQSAGMAVIPTPGCYFRQPIQPLTSIKSNLTRNKSDRFEFPCELRIPALHPEADSSAPLSDETKSGGGGGGGGQRLVTWPPPVQEPNKRTEPEAPEATAGSLRADCNPLSGFPVCLSVSLVNYTVRCTVTSPLVISSFKPARLRATMKTY